MAATLHSSFSDASDTDYDRFIEKTRKKMESTDPTASLREISVAITVLKSLHNEYYRRPCVEGYALGLFTPHRSRIIRRIKTLEDEKTQVHEPSSQAFERDKDRALKKQERLDKVKMLLSAAKQYKERTETIKQGFLYKANL
ncbi:hypothetical protein LCGC14_2165730 [marine sediment metagenome]|uniref:Uncharacterized protein n=1 Tax=marine sediment metagenome TaxID=412755 RepID=A0A0F9DRL0_9ZZZZ